MRFAEVFLRLGSSLVGWMVVYAHVLWLAVLFRLSCGPDGDEMHKLLLGMAPITIGFAFALSATRPLHEVHSMLRWLGIPLLLLMPFVARSVWQVFEAANLDAAAVCTDEPPATWQTLWAPAQVLTIALVLFNVLRMWRSVSADDSSVEKP